MSVYIVFTKEKTVDQAEFDLYQSKVPATLAGHELKVLAAYGKQEVLEGPPSEGIVIIEFPTVEAAKVWYESPEYREVRKHRFNGATYRVVLVEGVG